MDYDYYDEKYDGQGPGESDYQYDPRTGQYVKGLVEYKDLSRVQKEGRRRRLYLGTTVVGGRIGEIMQRLEKRVFKTANVGEIYDNDIDLLIEEIESEDKLPGFEAISKEILNYDLKVIPFIYYTNPKLILLALYYRKYGKQKNTEYYLKFMEYLRDNLISKWDICRYNMYLNKILKTKVAEPPVKDATPNVDRYLEIYRSERIRESRVKDKSSLNENFPDIFISGYPRFCQYQPSIIQANEKNKYKNYLEFPENNYLACVHKNYPYIGTKENYLENNEEYPLLPCCYTKPTDTKEDVSTIDPKKPVGNKTIFSINEVPRYAFLPEDLLLLFKLIDVDIFRGEYTYLRMSVDKSPISSLLCLTSIFPEIGISKAKRQIKRLVKSNVGSSTFINTNNIDYVIETEQFLDASQFIPIYERIYDCKIIYFCLNKQYSEGSICSQKYKIKIFSKPDVDKPYIFLFESMGSVVDKYKYPQYEYIVRGKITKNKVTNILNDYYTMDSDQEMLKKLLDIYKTLFPIENFKLEFKTNITYQKYDYNGFIRMLLFNNGISCLIDPIQAMNIDYKNLLDNFTIRAEEHTYNKVLEFMRTEGIKKIEKYEINGKTYGLVGYKKINKNKAVKIYVPVCNVDNKIIELPSYDTSKASLCPKNLVCSNTDLVNDDKNSYIQKYIYLSQVSRCLLAYTYYLFSLKLNEMNKLENTVNNYEEIKAIMSDRFIIDNTDNTDNTYYNNSISLSRNLSLSSNLLDNGKLKVPSQECKERLIYSLITKYRQDPSYIENYFNNRFIPDFYVDIRDFNIDINFLLLNNSSLMLFYNYETPKYTLNFNLIDEDIFYLQNPKIEDNEKLLVVRSDKIENAIDVCHNWYFNNINTDEKIDDNYSLESFNIKLYKFSGSDISEEDIFNNPEDSRYYSIGVAKTEDNIYYYSFLYQ